MSKKWKLVVSITIVSMIIPIAVGVGVSLPIFKHIVINNDWIGFWGSYVGTFLGGMITLYVLWSTITDNENARKRDEKLKFFDKVTEMTAELNTAVGNLFELATRILDAPDNNELFRLFWQQANLASGIGAEMNILLASREEIYDYKEFWDSFSKTVEQINKIADWFEYKFSTQFSNKEEVGAIDQEIDNILGKTMELQKILVRCIKNNLY